MTAFGKHCLTPEMVIKVNPELQVLQLHFPAENEYPAQFAAYSVALSMHLFIRTALKTLF